jgi:hypothetical protein
MNDMRLDDLMYNINAARRQLYADYIKNADNAYA